MNRGAWQATVHGVARVGHDVLHCLSKIHMSAQSLSHVRLFATPWALAHQALLSMEFSKQVHWSGLPFPSPGDLLGSGNERVSLVLPALAGNFFFTTRATWEALKTLEAHIQVSLTFEVSILRSPGTDKGAEALQSEMTCSEQGMGTQVCLPTRLKPCKRRDGQVYLC